MWPRHHGEILVRIPASTGFSADELGEIVRVVGNSTAYVSVPSGRSFAFSAEDIEGYLGQRFEQLGLTEGAPVRVRLDPEITSGLSVLVPGSES